MKYLAIGLFLVSTQITAQAADLSELKNLMVVRENSLEKVYEGMSREFITTASMTLETGECAYTQKSSQTVLKIMSDKMIIISQNTFTPAASDICTTAGYKAFEETILFTDAKPSIEKDLAELEALSESIESINISGELVTIKESFTTQDAEGNNVTEEVTLKTDLSKPIFKNLLSTEGEKFSTTLNDVADKDKNTFNLSDILFCQNNDGDNSECVRGNYSDILF